MTNYLKTTVNSRLKVDLVYFLVVSHTNEQGIFFLSPFYSFLHGIIFMFIYF
jgi:hypothetical protein